MARELNRLGAAPRRRAARAARAARRQHRPAGPGTRHRAGDRPPHRLAASASRPRRSTTRSTTPSASGRSPRCSRSSTSTGSSSRSSPSSAGARPASGRHLRPGTPPGGPAGRGAARHHDPDGPTTAPLVDQPPGAVPGGDAVVQPGAAAPRWATRSRAVEATTQQLGLPASIQGSFQGTAQAFQASLANEPLADPGGAGGGLHRAGRALRELHPPAHHPLHAAVGGRGRAAGAAGLPARS